MSKITIVIPLLDRHEFTERVLSYYNLNKVEYLFYIADGSKQKKFNQQSLKKKFPNIKIFYKSFPFDRNFRLFNKKMVKVAESIKSPYVYQLSNDDFFNPNFLKKSELFLSKNKSYNFVGGKVRNFKVIQLFKNVNDFGFFKMQKIVQYSDYKNIYKSIKNNNRIKRVENFVSSLTYECLIKRVTYLEIWKSAYKFQVINSFELNWFMNIIPLIRGKKYFINMTSTLRQCNTYEGLGLSDMLKSGAKKERYLNFLAFLKKQKILSSELIIKKLKKTNDSNIDIIDPLSQVGKKHFFKTKWFPFYTLIKNNIKKFNFYLFFMFFLFKKNKYKFLFYKVKKHFDDNKNI
jgi:glycosyltransferase domain-containing protein